MLRFFFEALRHARVVFAIFLLSTLVMGFYLTHLRTNIAIEKILPAHFHSVSKLKDLIKYYPEKRSLLLGFSRKDESHLTSTDLCAIKKFLTQTAQEMPELARIDSIFSLRKTNFDGKRLFYPTIIPDVCLDNKINLPDNNLKSTPWEGIFYSEDQKMIFSQFEFSDDAKDPKYEVFSDEVYKRFRGLVDNFQVHSPNLKVIDSGTAPFEALMIRGIERFGLLNLILLFVLLGSHRLIYGTWKAGFLFLITLLISGVLLHGGIALFGGALDFVTNSLFLMIAVATLQDFTFLSFFQMNHKFHYKKTFLHFLIPGFFTSLTTMIGFGSLITSDLANIKLFGACAAIGSLIEWAAIFFFLPAFISIFPSFQNWTNRDKAVTLQFKTGFLIWPKKLTLILSLGLILLVPYWIQKIDIADEPNWAFPKSNPYRQDQDALKSKLGWEYPISLVLQEDQQKIIEPKLESYLFTQKFIVRKESVKNTLHYLTRDLAPDLAGLVQSQVENGGLLNRLVSKESGTQRMILYLQNGSNKMMLKLENDVHSICPNDECWLAGILDTYVDYVSRVSHTLIASLFTSFFLVLTVILWILGARRFKDGVPILISIFFGPAALCAVLALLRISVNMNTAICMSVIVGLSGDNALQFLLSKQKKLHGAVRFKSTAAIVTGLMMATISTIFLFSYLQPPRELGLLLIFSFLICLFGDVFVLQSLMKKRDSPLLK